MTRQSLDLIQGDGEGQKAELLPSDARLLYVNDTGDIIKASAEFVKTPAPFEVEFIVSGETEHRYGGR